LETAQALVRLTAQQADESIDHCRDTRLPLVKVYRTRILGGNHWGKTNRRLKVLRNTKNLPESYLILKRGASF
jgi:hypothetical protein